MNENCRDCGSFLAQTERGKVYCPKCSDKYNVRYSEPDMDSLHEIAQKYCGDE